MRKAKKGEPRCADCIFRKVPYTYTMHRCSLQGYRVAPKDGTCRYHTPKDEEGETK